jgi:broad specificity phosphatase PhoE
MRTDLNTLKRRPFLFPLLMPVAMMAIAVGMAVWVFDARATTVVLLVRHAETEQQTDPDPNLSVVGKERAARLARVLAQLQMPRAIDAILSADTRRAQQTVQPLAEALALPINLVPQSGWESVVRRIRREHQGEVVLVVGDAKGIPVLLGKFTEEPTSIPENEFDRLYVVFTPQLSRTKVLRLSY